MINYYEENAEKYIVETIKCDVSEQYNLFLKYMPRSGKILDIGFGSGRDMIYFNSQGYDVVGIDPTQVFIDNMHNQGYSAFNLQVENLNCCKKYDGIWACASLLHVKRENLRHVFFKCKSALKENGIMYCSFKYGDKEIIKDNRYFNYVNEKLIKEVASFDNFKIIEITKTNDVRNNHIKEKWLNIILKKL